MPGAIQELGYATTPLGDLTLRRRIEPRLDGREVFEVKLGDEYLMSSLFTEAEQQLATLGLAPLSGDLDVVVGGLGLGYTAAEALKNPSVESLLVIDLFQPVIDWHQNGLVPLGPVLASDPRCEIRQGDFFSLARTGFDTATPGRKFDAVLLDIDHSPEHHLDADNKSFYTTEGLTALRSQLKPKGVFALWSDDAVSADFIRHLGSVFDEVIGRDINFRNPYTNSTSVNGVYVAHSQSAYRLLRLMRAVYGFHMIEWSTCREVERNPKKVSGALIFRGSRVPVTALFENLESGASVDDFLDWFPGITREQVDAVLEHAISSLESERMAA